MSKKIFKPLAVGLILLFIGLAFQPAVSTNELIKDEIKPNKYLFDTVIEIINNPKIKNLFSQINQKEIIYSNNFKASLIKTLIKKPVLLASMIFNRPMITNNYLISTYYKGINTINVLGEDKSNEIINLLKSQKSNVINDLTNIISENEELNEKILKLQNINREITPDGSFASNPIICTIFTSLTVFCVVAALFIKDIASMIPDGSQLYSILLSMVSPFIDIALIFASVASVFGCWDDWPGV
ncbi:hypothetical protein AYK24_04820 [Thermoplasmatales archaeon SG8-52-4]|nr:MAG: hypothetical protein AYK24_04820 [Thermoplasmatales archaeon SG8-52-4]